MHYNTCISLIKRHVGYSNDYFARVKKKNPKKQKIKGKGNPAEFRITLMSSLNVRSVTRKQGLFNNNNNNNNNENNTNNNTTKAGKNYFYRYRFYCKTAVKIRILTASEKPSELSNFFLSAHSDYLDCFFKNNLGVTI